MDELIKIHENTGKNDLGEKIVDARDLYIALGVKTRFADWIKYRINEYGFIEGTDFVSFSEISEKPQGGRPSSIYAITIDMAKELAMIENNEKGRAVRKYFIAVEKAARKQIAVPATFAEALELAARQQREIEGQNKEIARMKQKAEFVERAVECAELTEISMACKVLNLPYGRNIFYDLLRQTGIFFKNRNEPMQKLVAKGYFKMKQKVIERVNHPDIVVNVPFMTEKGIVRMSAWLKEQGFYNYAYTMKFLGRI
jgi:anti-repressor protein